MKFDDIDSNLYSVFQHEFQAEFTRTNKRWSHFINNKDLGISYCINNIYTIVDNKKWLLAIIKYGI